VEVVGNGVEALAAIRRAVPDVVLTDMQMPEMNGLQLVDALRGEFPGLPVVLNTEYGSEELAVEALRAGATYYIPKRNLAREVGPLLDELLSVSTAQRKHSLFLDRMTAAEYRFDLENDPDLIPQVVGHVEALLRQMQLFDPGVRVRVGVAVHEAVVNAMVHGNLEIGSEAKTGDWELYHALIALRRTQGPYQARRVAVAVRVTRAPYLEVRVADQGPGFDPAAVPDPTSPANMGASSGRGLFLIRTFFDRVTHSPTGNEIVMVKGTES
jgi:CheY-like chemotaxis protein